MRVHDLPPMPADYFILRPNPKQPDGDKSPAPDHRVEDQSREKRDQPARQPRKRAPRTPYTGSLEHDDENSYVATAATPQVDILA